MISSWLPGGEISQKEAKNDGFSASKGKIKRIEECKTVEMKRATIRDQFSDCCVSSHEIGIVHITNMLKMKKILGSEEGCAVH